MTSVVYTHRRDVDGLMSAAIFLRVHPLATVKFVDYGLDDMKHLLIELSELKVVELTVIADFGLDDDKRDAMVTALSSLVSRGTRVDWLDHHSWSAASMEAVRRAGVELVKPPDREACGAELVQRRYAPSDDYSKRLAELAHATDFHEPLDEIGRVLTGVVDYYNSLTKAECDKKLERLAQVVSEGVLVDSVVYNDYCHYTKLVAHSEEELRKTARLLNAGGFRVAVGFATGPLGPTRTCDVLRETFPSDIQVYVKGRKVSFRRSNENIDCAKIAKAFRGGGHDYAAGGELEFDANTDEAREKFLQLLMHALEDL
jgi:oligoribonuclease NrnB/cAMP/cGMP phosphodiesterase (DHH superfamily)